MPPRRRPRVASSTNASEGDEVRGLVDSIGSMLRGVLDRVQQPRSVKKKDVFDVGAIEFKGAKGPLDAHTWLDKMKMTFESTDLPEEKKVKMADFDATYKSGSSSSVKSELQKYLDEERLDRKTKEFDVLSWWKMEQLRYPVLGHLACDVLTIPISTVASESAFSIAGRVLDQNRSSLLPETVQALLCCRDWLFGKKDQHHTDWEQLSENVLDLTLDG
ncbi:hypothetical protein ACLB2K_059846 [Fragaria x ananassa]